MQKKTLFVTGISTEIGKTVVSAILTRALEADYWKPVQSGDLDNTDSDKIANWTNAKIHPEGFRLHTPMSPHASAEIDGVEIKLSDFHIPKTDNHLIIEGAGGLYVPLNDEDCVIDLIKKLAIPVVLVSQNYLGSINHTMLSIKALQEKEIPIYGVIFNGESTPTTESIIQKMTGVRVITRIDTLPEINAAQIAKESEKIRDLLY